VSVKIICITTLCGRIGPGVLGSRFDRLRLENARDSTQASLLGARTLREGEPEMRIAGKVPDNRIRAIVTGKGKIALDKKLFRHGPRPIIYTSPEGAGYLRARHKDFFELVEIKKVDAATIDLGLVIKDLQKRGAKDILIEGGGRLNHSALNQKVVDELLLTIAPKIHGQINIQSLVDGPVPAGNPFINLELLESEPQKSGELFLRYKVINQ